MVENLELVIITGMSGAGKKQSMVYKTMPLRHVFF